MFYLREKTGRLLGIFVVHVDDILYTVNEAHPQVKQFLAGLRGQVNLGSRKMQGTASSIVAGGMNRIGTTTASR